MENNSNKPNMNIKSEQQDYIFYWESSVNKKCETNSKEYKEYDFSIQVFLNYKYKEFLNGSGIVVKLIPPLQNYEVNFESFFKLKSKTTFSQRN